MRRAFLNVGAQLYEREIAYVLDSCLTGLWIMQP